MVGAACICCVKNSSLTESFLSISGAWNGSSSTWTKISKLAETLLTKRMPSVLFSVPCSSATQADIHDSRRRDEANGLSLKATRCESTYDSERKRLDGVLAHIMKNLNKVEKEVETFRQFSESDSSETEAVLHSCQVKETGKETYVVFLCLF